jgi:Ca2+-binding RTX toxin-like protein
MRKIAILVGAVALLTMLFAGVALARTFTCTDLPCHGTNNPDVIDERPAYGTPDVIYGHRGADTIDAGRSGGDVDVVYGGRGGDTINTDDSDDDDTVYAGMGTDTCRVDAGDEYFSCEVVYVDGVLQP